ncbi:hypothetical protein ONS95_007050 [Cadophora gregata]|uniref:uncharacterized protein n=1 Tax=Cadophora gregata TaxID=51156 RepID=UPI0026DAD4C4|nr:uncharacterized protein ONS95_007050 [Cadophora gregata]KAK0100593.1 hypothetical protein ONS95_007050 [Cadophora gregata]
MSGHSTPGKAPAIPSERTNSMSTELSSHETIPSIDTICPPEIFTLIIQDYLERQYPIHPLIHIPTFKQQISQNLHQTDPKLFSFTISLCATFCAVQPRRFAHYQSLCAAFKTAYPTIRDFVKRVHLVIQRQRDPDAYEDLTMTDWALACTLFMSHACIGQSSSARMYKAEATAIIIELVGGHRLGKYANPIEVQLRKKAFWITVAAHICLRITGESLETLTDRSVFEQVDAENLQILPLDDEYITADSILAPPPGEPQLTAAFCETTKLIKTMAAITKDPTQPKAVTAGGGLGLRHMSSSSSSSSSSECFVAEKLGACGGCGRVIRMAPRMLVFRNRLGKVAGCLRGLPGYLAAGYEFGGGGGGDEDERGSGRGGAGGDGRLKARQIETVRTNMHVEHLWMQNVLIERLSMASKTESDGAMGPKDIWELREEVCRRLLGVLDRAKEEFVEPNGHALILKIRQIAASLLDFQPSDDPAQMEIVRSAQLYLKRFTDALKRLDSSYLHGQVIDMNIMNQQHMALAANRNAG